MSVSADIYVKILLQILKIPPPPVFRTQFHNPVKSRSAERRSRGYQSERSVRVSAGPQVHVAASKTWKRHLHARIRFSRRLRYGVQPRINHFSCPVESSQPACIR